MNKNLADFDSSPRAKHFKASCEQSPIWLLGLPPVMEAKHDGEGAGGQQLFFVVVVQAVGVC